MTPTTLIRGHDKAVIRFYRAIADNSRLGMFLYPVPSVTRYDLPVELTALLLDTKMISTTVEASYPGLDVRSGGNDLRIGFATWPRSTPFLSDPARQVRLVM